MDPDYPPPDPASSSPSGENEAAPEAVGAPPPPETVSAPPPPETDRRPRASRRTRLLVAAVAVVVALAATGTWLVTRAGSAGSHRSAPGLESLLDLASLGEELTALPIGDDGATAMEVGSLQILRLALPTGEAIVAADTASSSPYPLWLAPVPTADTGADLRCHVVEEVLRCGDLLALDLDTGTNQMTSSEAVTVRDPQAQASPAAGLTVGTDAGAPADDAAIPESATSTSQAATPSTDPTPQTAPQASSWTRLTETPSEDVPLAVDAQGVLTATGTQVAGLTLEGSAPVWAAKVEVPHRLGGLALPVTREVWVVCDGLGLSVVDGSELVWQRDLPEGSAALNGTAQERAPRLLVDPGAIVLTEPEGVVAVDPLTGAVLWQTTTPVTSWAPSAQTIVVLNGATVSVLSFEDVTAPATALPTAAPRSPEETLDLEWLKNTTLEVPSLCTAAASETGTAAFVDGVATGPSFGGAAAATATMKEVRPGVFDGQPVALVVMTCYGGGNTAFDTLAAYSQAGELLGEVDLVISDDIGHTPDLVIEDLLAVGNTVVFTVPSIQVAGDTACHACPGSAQATVTAQWDRESLGVADVLYTLPSGSLRVPSTSDVQVAYDAIASGDRSAAEEFMSPDLAAHLDSRVGVPGSPETVRSIQFPAGGTVVSCALASPGGLHGPSFSVPGVPSGYGSVEPGAVICPNTSDDPAYPWLQAQQNQYGEETYASWLVLSADEDGGFRVTAFG